MDLLNYLSPFEELPINITLHKVNKNFFGKDVVELSSQRKIYDYLVSPLDVVFLRVETDEFEKAQIHCGEIIIVERASLKLDGMAVVQLNGKLCIREISHDKDFVTIIIENSKALREGIDFNFFGIITYILRSDEEEYLEMIGDELFKICS